MYDDAKILVVEDEEITALEIENSLKEVGYEVIGLAASYHEAIDYVVSSRPDLVLMDIKLKGDYDGIRTAEDIHKIYDIPVVYLTAYSDMNTLSRAKKTHPYNFITKPFNDYDLRASIMIALNHYYMEKDIREKEYWLSSLLNSMNEAIITTDQVGRIKWMNTHAELLIGYEAKEVKDVMIDEVLHFVCSDTKENITHPSSQILQSVIHVSFNENISMITRRRSKIPVKVRGNPILNRDDSVIGSVLFIQIVRGDI
ncbi:response regulator [bacterium]|nr:response regulator [bacterium]